jgi:hypothetical protein
MIGADPNRPPAPTTYQEVVHVEPTQILVVANQTSTAAGLRAEIVRRARSAPHVFHLVVPATPPHEHMTYTEGDAHDIARRQMEAAVDQLRAEGVEITGSVGDASPVLAIGDALIVRPYDEIVLSTLPAGASRWLKQDLPRRVQRRFDIPLTVVIAEPAHVVG